MLSVTNLHKTFNAGTVNEIQALRGVSFTLEDGGCTCVLGTNGSGKSTLLNAVAGAFFPDKGTIVLDGVDITLWPEYKRAQYVGRVFQNPLSGTAPDMSIAENLSLALKRGKPRGLGRGISGKLKEEFCRMVKPLNMDLEDRLDSPIGKLSGGQRQALTLLMASALKPKLLLLDEHTAALDPGTAAKVIDLTQMIVTRDRLTTLMVTHSMQQAVNLGDRILMLHNGKIVHDLRGEEKKMVRPHDLLSLFDEIRKKEQIDPSTAEMLQSTYI